MQYVGYSFNPTIISSLLGSLGSFTTQFDYDQVIFAYCSLEIGYVNIRLKINVTQQFCVDKYVFQKQRIRRS